MNKRYLLVGFTVLTQSLSLFAMESLTLTENKEGWLILPNKVIDSAIKDVESQTQSYTCGPITLAHCAKASNLDCKENFVKECPLSVEASVQALKSNTMVWNAVSSKMTDQAMKEGALRVGPAPEQMEKYFNSCFEASPNQLLCISENNMSKEGLVGFLKDSIAQNLPAIILVQYNMMSLHYLLVVGINEITQEIMVMDTVKNNQQLRKENIAEVYNKMDVSSTVNFVKLIDGLAPLLNMVGINLDMILSQRASSAVVQSWGNYNVLVVLPSEKVKREINERQEKRRIAKEQFERDAAMRRANNPQQGGCAQQ